MKKNIQRDKDVNKKLQEDGWTVLRFWQREIEADVSKCADKIEYVIKSRR